jgi:hypothetical protein
LLLFDLIASASNWSLFPPCWLSALLCCKLSFGALHFVQPSEGRSKDWSATFGAAFRRQGLHFVQPEERSAYNRGCTSCNRRSEALTTGAALRATGGAKRLQQGLHFVQPEERSREERSKEETPATPPVVALLPSAALRVSCSPCSVALLSEGRSQPARVAGTGYLRVCQQGAVSSPKESNWRRAYSPCLAPSDWSPCWLASHCCPKEEANQSLLRRRATDTKCSGGASLTSQGNRAGLRRKKGCFAPKGARGVAGPANRQTKEVILQFFNRL